MKIVLTPEEFGDLLGASCQEQVSAARREESARADWARQDQLLLRKSLDQEKSEVQRLEKHVRRLQEKVDELKALSEDDHARCVKLQDTNKMMGDENRRLLEQLRAWTPRMGSPNQSFPRGELATLPKVEVPKDALGELIRGAIINKPVMCIKAIRLIGGRSEDGKTGWTMGLKDAKVFVEEEIAKGRLLLGGELPAPVQKEKTETIIPPPLLLGPAVPDTLRPPPPILEGEACGGDEPPPEFKPETVTHGSNFEWLKGPSSHPVTGQS
jgi:hypothetical protein